MSTEEWRDIPGWEGCYAVSNLGRVKSLERKVPGKLGSTRTLKERILKPLNTKSGHLNVRLYSRDHKCEWNQQGIHRLVALAFIGPCPQDMEVCHNDGNPSNNIPTNLRYGTRSDNQLDIVKHGNNPRSNRTHCKRHNHKLDGANINSYDRARGWRSCRSCSNATSYLQDHDLPDSWHKRIADKYYEQHSKELN